MFSFVRDVEYHRIFIVSLHLLSCDTALNVTVRASIVAPVNVKILLLVYDHLVVENFIMRFLADC